MKRMESTHSRSPLRKREIIAAALNCFTELGYNETTMQDICVRSKASNGSVYHHFKGKEQLAAEVYLEGITEYQSGLLNDLEKQRGAFQGIKAIVRFHLTWVARNPDWARYLFQKRHFSFLIGTEQRFNILNKAFVQRISKWFMRHVESGAIRRMPWDVMIAILLGPCQEFARLHLSGKALTKIEKAITELADSAWLSLSMPREKK
jgi:AcrR family transcriptional regulator